MATNTVYVTGDAADLNIDGDDFQLENVHWINDAPKTEQSYKVRTRYRARLIDGALERVGERWQVKLTAAERAISPGQSAVIYDGDEVLGGGIIAGS
jgi:tRNA-specific 2-thiouridylase